MDWYIAHSKYIIVGFVLLAGVLSLFRPVILGRLGETSVSARLARLPKDRYTVFHDVLLDTSRGTTQIDHIVVAETGIFVIETKNYTGWIFGTDQGREWTQNIYGKKYPFYNPLLQNQGHVRALSETLRLPEDRFFPVVVFSSRATLKLHTSRTVLYTGKLNGFITSHTEPVLSRQQTEDVIRALKSANRSDRAAKAAHIQSVRASRKESDSRARQGVCPRCGGVLVRREGKYGAFLGCSGFPACRFTKKL